MLVGAGDHAYLADFGLTKASDDAAMTETGQFVGTIDYISPEQARGENATARSDVYALTGRAVRVPHRPGPVREGDRGAGPARAPERARRRGCPRLRADLPAAMDEVVAEGMAKDPEARPASAGELMLKARRALGAAPAAPAPTPSAETRPSAAPPPRWGATRRVREERCGRDPPRRDRRDAAGRNAPAPVGEPAGPARTAAGRRTPRPPAAGGSYRR